jgi:proteasome beta subunit
VEFKTDPFSSSFYDFLTSHYPYLLPGAVRNLSNEFSESHQPVMHGTTVLAIKYQEGVVVAGDRRATEGFQVSGRRIEKVYKVDEHSAIAIAGAAGPAIELAKLFQTEMEHYEKLEGVELSTDGKANKLSQMVKANLPMAFQGLVVVPIFAGYDLAKKEGRIFKYDITGGRYEETDHYATGSGGKDARNTIKKLYKHDMKEDETVRLALEALYDAAEEDIGTGGPDLIRGIYPTVKIVTEAGISDGVEERMKRIYNELLDSKRKEN